MTLTLHLSPELEQRLTEEARRRCLDLDEYILQLLEIRPSPQDRPRELASLLQSWMEGDDSEEQRETAGYLTRVLDEDRLAARPLFPPELKGVTW